MAYVSPVSHSLHLMPALSLAFHIVNIVFHAFTFVQNLIERQVLKL